MWTTPQMVYMFACLIRCFINNDWEIIERVIDFKPLEDKDHEGLYGGKAFTDGACKISGFDKISLHVTLVTVTGFHCTALASQLTMPLSMMLL